ncbi:hypothetical protein SEA_WILLIAMSTRONG_59 [Microbacterium phage WilliamStrong]|nr:hypothetical protein SEA_WILLIAMSTRONG_59 [Microbacterium phage WilliamStrong]
MALAYAVVFADSRLYDQHTRETVEAAQREADKQFERVAQESRKTLVTRNPEPRVMTWPEMRKLAPQANLEGLVGLYFTADIS